LDLERIRGLLARKPEVVNRFPDWLLPPDVRERLAGAEGLAIAEIAGRDSIAAVLAAVEERPVRAVLPTIAYTGTEFGDWAVPLEQCGALARRLEAKGVEVYPPVVLGSPRFWWLLCGRPIQPNFSQFGFYTPCLGCHLYLHALRVPLARQVGADLIVGGERERHDDQIKINQVAEALDAYRGFARDFGVDLLFPLRRVESAEEVLEILGEDWGEGAGQMECVLSRNYEDVNGNLTFDPAGVTRFFAEFAVPVATKVVHTYLAGEGLEGGGI